MNATQAETLRHLCLEILAARAHMALSRRAIRRVAAAEVDFKFTDDELDAAFTLLKDMGFVRKEPDPLGATEYWQATGAGVLAYERGGTG